MLLWTEKQGVIIAMLACVVEFLVKTMVKDDTDIQKEWTIILPETQKDGPEW